MAARNIVRDQRDWNQIDINDRIEVEYLHYQFPWLSHKQIKEVVKEHGPDRNAVEAALEKVGSG